MGGGEDVEAVICAKRSKPAVTKLASRHFNGHAMLRSVSQSIETIHEALDPEPFALLADEFLIPVRFGAAQTEIAMGNSVRGPGEKLRGPVQHIHRVYAAADCKQHSHHLRPFSPNAKVKLKDR